MANRWRYAAAAVAVFLAAECLMALDMVLAGSRVLVYMYHSVSEEPISEDNYNDEFELSVRPGDLEEQLRFFKDRGFKSAFADELAELPSGRDRYVVLTFDDGYEDNYTNLFPLLKKYDIKATVFMITGFIGQPGYLSAEQIKEMSDSGLVSVQSHTVYHEILGLGDLTDEQVRYEVAESKAMLEAVTGRPVTALSIPNGSYDDRVMTAARENYRVVMTGTDYEPFDPKKPWDVHRVGIYRRFTIEDIRNMTDNRGLYLVKRVLKKLAGL